jgi:hypothetical protein
LHETKKIAIGKAALREIGLKYKQEQKEAEQSHIINNIIIHFHFMIQTAVDASFKRAKHWKCSWISINTGVRDENTPPHNDKAITISKNSTKKFSNIIIKTINF